MQDFPCTRVHVSDKQILNLFDKKTKIIRYVNAAFAMYHSVPLGGRSGFDAPPTRIGEGDVSTSTQAQLTLTRDYPMLIWLRISYQI